MQMDSNAAGFLPVHVWYMERFGVVNFSAFASQSKGNSQSRLQHIKDQVNLWRIDQYIMYLQIG